MFSLIKSIILKDLLIEYREKGNLYYVFILTCTFSLLFTNYLKENHILFSYYVTLLITNILLSQRISRLEIGRNDELIVFNLPVDLSAFCISKIIYSLILFLFQASILFIFYNLFSQTYIIEINFNFIAFTLLFLIGLSIFFTCFSLLLERIKGEGQFMFIAIFPLIIPFLFLCFNGLNDLYYLGTGEYINSFNFQLLLAFDILLITVCPILFSYALRR
tara:strand:+ start:115517 stop:116173 length:657 start_codon:yes stop_codon:yes gene_type:complete